MIEEKKPFVSHLKRARDRILICIVAVGVAFIATYYFKERIFGFLMLPFTKVMPPKFPSSSHALTEVSSRTSR